MPSYHREWLLYLFAMSASADVHSKVMAGAGRPSSLLAVATSKELYLLTARHEVVHLIKCQKHVSHLQSYKLRERSIIQI
jgi:hypothetical protein